MHDGFAEIKRMHLEGQIKNLESSNLILRKLDELQETVHYAVDSTHENREEIHRLKNRLSYIIGTELEIQAANIVNPIKMLYFFTHSSTMEVVMTLKLTR